MFCWMLVSCGGHLTGAFWLVFGILTGIFLFFFCKLTAFNLLPMSANYDLCQVI